jgi:hypothetical protein
MLVFHGLKDFGKSRARNAMMSAPEAGRAR